MCKLSVMKRSVVSSSGTGTRKHIKISQMGLGICHGISEYPDRPSFHCAERVHVFACSVVWENSCGRKVFNF